MEIKTKKNIQLSGTLLQGTKSFYII